MADEKQPDDPEASTSRPAPRKRSDDEKALTLEVARLFGMSPRALLKRDASPQQSAPVESVPGEDDGEAKT